MEYLTTAPEKEYQEDFNLLMKIAETNYMADAANKIADLLMEKLKLWRPVFVKFLNCEEQLRLEECTYTPLQWKMTEFPVIDKRRLQDPDYKNYLEQLLEMLEIKEEVLNLWVNCIEKLLYGFENLIEFELPLIKAWYEATDIHRAHIAGLDVEKVPFNYSFQNPKEPILTMKNKSFIQHTFQLITIASELLSSRIILKAFAELIPQDGMALKNAYKKITECISKASNCRMLGAEDLPTKWERKAQIIFFSPINTR